MQLDDDRVLAKYILNRAELAINSPGSEVSDLREACLDGYRMDLYGDEVEGRSKYVTSEIFEAVEWALPRIAQVFLSRNVVKYQPTGPEDQDAARAESDTVNNLIKQNPGHWAAFFDAFKTALQYPNAYLKIDVEYKRKRTVEKYFRINVDRQEQLTEYYVNNLPGEATFRVENVEKYVIDGEEFRDFDVIVETPPAPEIVIDCIPPEQCLVDHEHKSVELDDCPFVAHKCEKTQTQLIDMGYDLKDLEHISPSNNSSVRSRDEVINRNNFEEEQRGFSADAPDDSMQLYEYIEAYIMYDYRKEGVAERRKVVVIGGEVLSNEPCDTQPFACFTAIRQPFSHIGMGVAQTLINLQRASSFFTRQVHDSVHAMGTGKKFISLESLPRDGSAIDDLQDRSSEFVFLKGDPRAAVFTDTPNPIPQTVLPYLEGFSGRAEKRAGVTIGAGLDPDVLQRTTASSVGNANEQLSSRLQLIIQSLAETGMKAAFIKIHTLLRQYIFEEQFIQNGSKWLQYNPSLWSPRSNVVVSTGLGLGNVAERMQFGMQLLGIQKELMAMGLVGPQQIYNTVSLITESFNIGDVTQYFIDPESPEFQPPQPQPDPQMELAKAEATKAQAQLQGVQVKAQVDGQKIQADTKQGELEIQYRYAQLEVEKLKLQIEMQKAKSMMESTKVKDRLAVMKTGFDAQVNAAKATIDLEKTESDKVESES